MTLWKCQGCTAAYSVGAARCPQCQSTDYEEDGAMPKTTRHGGPSNAATDPDAEGSEEPSAGNSSQTSTGQRQRSRKTNAPEDPSPARTTANRSPKDRTGSSTAAATDGDPTAASSDGDD